MKKYNTINSVTVKEVKDFRKKHSMTQKDFAAFIGVSKVTVERWETGDKPIEGPVAMLISMLTEHEEWMEAKEIPEKRYNLRMWYMFRDRKCTLIDVDEINQKVAVKNYVTNIFFRAFGANDEPTFEDYKEFLKSRCFPETRDKMKIQLEMLGIPFYDPMLIIEKTQGRMAEDEFWILIER